VIPPVATLKFAPQLAPVPAMAATIRAAAQAPVQKIAATAFNQLVAQIVADSAAPEIVPTPAPAVKPPLKTTTTPADQSPELPAPVRTAPAPTPAPFTDTLILSVAPVGSRRAATTSSPEHAQPSSVPVDLNIPIPIAPKLQVPSFAGGGLPEQKPPVPTAVSNAEETAPITLEPKPILEIKIHLNQEVTPAVQSTVVAASAAQEKPERGSTDPGDADAVPVVEPSGHAAPRTAGNQEVVATVQPAKLDAGPPQPLAPDPATPPVAALPAPPPAPAPMTTRSATPEQQTSSAPLREEPPIDPIKTPPPLRSLALEFAPDGAGDIRVRLSERAGDVHISLHGTDSLLAGRVREGVGDLVGSLSKAGYEAEAWTPGEGRQNQRQQPDRRQSARGANPEEFSGILQQPIQETS
jgi:hypothetical protein